MAMIKGVPVTLYEMVEVGKDPFNTPIYEEVPVVVENVLIQPVTTMDLDNTVNLFGKKAIYTLGIPKSDTHDWIEKKVRFFGADWKTVGYPIEGIEAMIPLEWNKKITVERYHE